MSNLNNFSYGKLRLTYRNPSNQIPSVTSVIFDGQDLSNLTNKLIFSTLVGTRRIQPFEEVVNVENAFQDLIVKFFNELTLLKTVRRDLAVGCADFFNQHICKFYWHLICNIGSKNIANAFLETICTIVDKWEKKTGQEIHKGTPFYFLTFGFLQEGDIDSAFASMFKAINEDKKSIDPILGKGAYKMSPAYKYVSLVDDKNNYLYDSITNLRKMVRKYITKFNRKITAKPRFSIGKLDSRLLQNDDEDIQQIKHLFTYSLEKNRAYLKQMKSLPENDFYKIKNANLFFNLGLITDKILEKIYIKAFRIHVPRRSMTMSDGVALLFEDKGWIGSLPIAKKRDPRRALNFTPNIPKDPKDLIEKFFLNPVTFHCNGRSMNFEMLAMQTAVKLRNFAGHNIKKQDIFVKKHSEIVEWLLSSIFVAVSVMPNPPRRYSSRIESSARRENEEHSTTTTTTTYHTSSQTARTSLPLMGTIGPWEEENNS